MLVSMIDFTSGPSPALYIEECEYCGVLTVSVITLNNIDCTAGSIHQGLINSRLQ